MDEQNTQRASENKLNQDNSKIGINLAPIYKNQGDVHIGAKKEEVEALFNKKFDELEQTLGQAAKQLRAEINDAMVAKMGEFIAQWAKEQSKHAQNERLTLSMADLEGLANNGDITDCISKLLIAQQENGSSIEELRNALQESQKEFEAITKSIYYDLNKGRKKFFVIALIGVVFIAAILFVLIAIFSSVKEAVEKTTGNNSPNSSVETILPDLTYEVSDDGTYAILTEAKITTQGTTCEIASEYKGLPVTEIGKNAFYNSINLKEVAIPASVTKIGSLAFYGCSKLESISIPAGVTEIGASAFSGCKKLTTITIPDQVKVLEENLFYDCISLTNLTLGSGIERIENGVFTGCSNNLTVKYTKSTEDWEKVEKKGDSAAYLKGVEVLHEHTASTWITDVESTCTEAGSQHIECTICNMVLERGSIAAIGHDYGEWMEVTAATCTEVGIEERVCSHNSEHIESRGIDMIPHTESAWITDVEATCTETGSQHTECTVCKTRLQEESIEKIAHIESAWITDKAATCTETGSKHTECTDCEEELETETISALGHDYGEWREVKAVTCTEVGIEIRSCRRDSTHTESRGIDKIPHTPSEWIEDKTATCTETGKKHTECSVCKTTLQEGTIDKIAHTESEWIIDKAATCTETGKKHTECSICRTTLQEGTIDKIAHTESEWIIDKAATCTETGKRHTECSVCKTTLQEETIDKIAHTPSEWIIDKAATCTEDGSRYTKCTVCEATLTTETIPALGHDYSEWTVVKAATCTKEGMEARLCERDNFTEGREIAKTAHTESDWIIDKEATYIEEGCKHTECIVCKTILREETIDKIAHIEVYEIKIYAIEATQKSNGGYATTDEAIKTIYYKDEEVYKGEVVSEAGFYLESTCQNKISSNYNFYLDLSSKYEELVSNFNLAGCYTSSITNNGHSYATVSGSAFIDENGKILETSVVKNITLYAMCIPKSITITFKDYDGLTQSKTKTVSEKTFYYGEAGDAKSLIAWEIDQPERTYYTFNGYTTNDTMYFNASGKCITDVCNSLDAGFYTLTAKWSRTSSYTYISSSAYTDVSAQAVYTLSKISEASTENYLLVSDVDLNGETWTPISTFSGIFDGDGHKISNINTSKNSGVSGGKAYSGGFIQINSGTIKSVVFENITVNTSITQYTNDNRYFYVGGVVGYNSGTVNNIVVYSSSVYGELLHQYDQNGAPNQFVFVGGLLGYNTNCLTNCYVEGTTVSGFVNAKKNYCWSTAVVGGVCAESSSVANISYLISCNNTIKAKSRGGFWGGINKDDGTLTCYSGYVIGVNYGSVSNIISCNQADGSINNSFENACDNPNHRSYSGLLIARSDTPVTNGYSVSGNCWLIGNSQDMISAMEDNEAILNNTTAWTARYDGKIVFKWMV
jgi:hypothetical protein